LVFFVPVIIYLIASYSNLEDTNIGLFVFTFLWPTFLALMMGDYLQTVFDYINFFILTIGFNVGLYLFLGWLFWLGKTRNKFYYIAPPTILFLIWNIFYGYLRPLFEF